MLAARIALLTQNDTRSRAPSPWAEPPMFGRRSFLYRTPIVSRTMSIARHRCVA